MEQELSFQTIIVFALISTLLIGLTSFTTAYSQVSVVAGGEKMVENWTSPLTAFVPRDIQISAGETVTWTNPTPVSEPHSITFFSNGTFFAPPLAAFTVPNSTEFTSVAQGANVEPTIVPSNSGDNNNETKTVLLDNARSTNPVVIDSTGKSITYLSPNSTYAFQGNEQYLNSGWMWPEGQVPPGAPYLATFTVKFEEPGTYPYICIVHPWMTGSVIVNRPWGISMELIHFE
jgi:plastocyanin